jgi:glycosidase
MAVLAATLPGMPLIYGGQESGLNKQLAFFEKDAILWGEYPHADFCGGLLQLKKEHPALRNGAAGGAVEILETGHQGVFRFQRARDGRRVRVTVNLTGQTQQLEVALGPWAYEIIVT